MLRAICIGAALLLVGWVQSGMAAEPPLWAGSGGGAHRYSTPGNDLGSASFAGYEDNFAWGRMALGAGDSLMLDGEAVYVGMLELAGGLPQIASIVGNGVNVYYDLREPGNAYLGGKSYELSGGGMLMAVPEPASLLMWLLAGAGIAHLRKRCS